MSALTMRWERIGAAMPPRKKMRRQGRHSLEFKMQVVQYALSLPEGNRIKPTCRQFQNIAPVQVRKWRCLLSRQPSTSATSCNST